MLLFGDTRKLDYIARVILLEWGLLQRVLRWSDCPPEGTVAHVDLNAFPLCSSMVHNGVTLLNLQVRV